MQEKTGFFRRTAAQWNKADYGKMVLRRDSLVEIIKVCMVSVVKKQKLLLGKQRQEAQSF